MKTLATILFLSLSASAIASERYEHPPSLFQDWGACPFECCTYQDWVVTKPFKIYKNISTKSKVTYHLKKHDKVVGITGVVITKKYGVVKILKPMKLGFVKDSEEQQLSLTPGEKIYTLHYLGEGQSLFWYKGKIYSDGVPIEKLMASPNSCEVEPETDMKVEQSAEYEWWVKVRAPNGIEGWTKEAGVFTGVDACG